MHQELLGRPQLEARTVERCERCRVERPLGSSAACRCVQPAWKPYCVRCARVIEGTICPHCLEVAETNGRQLRATLEGILAPRGGIAGALAAHERLKDRVTRAMTEFSISSALPVLPDWAMSLADPRAPLPPGTEHSRTKMEAARALRLEEAAVRLALDGLAYSGLPTEQRLQSAVGSGDSAAASLASWDGLVASPAQDHALREAARTLLSTDSLAATLLESITKRDLGRLVEAAVRRGRALEACRRAFGVG
ncbi:MAG: hypothetical protein GC172_06525 [Phycisphaera sp.]|nr:hypothetical protein [Phycisphaera sp.]